MHYFLRVLTRHSTPQLRIFHVLKMFFCFFSLKRRHFSDKLSNDVDRLLSKVKKGCLCIYRGKKERKFHGWNTSDLRKKGSLKEKAGQTSRERICLINAITPNIFLLLCLWNKTWTFFAEREVPVFFFHRRVNNKNCYKWLHHWKVSLTQLVEQIRIRVICAIKYFRIKFE